MVDMGAFFKNAAIEEKVKKFWKKMNENQGISNKYMEKVQLLLNINNLGF